MRALAYRMRLIGLLLISSLMGCGGCDETKKPTANDPAAAAEQLLAEEQAAASVVPSAQKAEGCGTIYEAITSMRERVGAGPLATGREAFVAVCRSLRPDVRRCLDPAVAAQEALDCSARVQALAPAEQARVKGLMRGRDPAPRGP